METRPRLKVSSDRLVKPGIEPATPGLQGKWFIHLTTAAPTFGLVGLEEMYSCFSKNFKMAAILNIGTERI